MILNDQQIAGAVREASKMHKNMFIGDNLGDILRRNFPEAEIWVVEGLDYGLFVPEVKAAYFQEARARRLIQDSKDDKDTLHETTVTKLENRECLYSDGNAIDPNDVYRPLYQEIVAPEFRASTIPEDEL